MLSLEFAQLATQPIALGPRIGEPVLVLADVGGEAGDPVLVLNRRQGGGASLGKQLERIEVAWVDRPRSERAGRGARHDQGQTTFELAERGSFANHPAGHEIQIELGDLWPRLRLELLESAAHGRAHRVADHDHRVGRGGRVEQDLQVTPYAVGAGLEAEQDEVDRVATLMELVEDSNPLRVRILGNVNGEVLRRQGGGGPGDEVVDLSAVAGEALGQLFVDGPGGERDPWLAVAEKPLQRRRFGGGECGTAGPRREVSGRPLRSAREGTHRRLRVHQPVGRTARRAVSRQYTEPPMSSGTARVLKGSSTTPERRQEPARRSPIAGRVLAALILLGAAALVGLAFWPGRMSGDTLDEIAQAMAGTYTDQHAPILEALWHPFIGHGIGPGWVLAGQLLVFAGGCYLILRHFLGRVVAALAAAAIMLTPPCFGMLGWVGRDVWFIALLLASFGCVARVLVSSGRVRIAWLCGVVIFGWLTMATHQDAALAVFVPVSFACGLWLVRSRPSWALRRRRLVGGALASGVAITLLMLGSQALVNGALNVRNTHELGTIFAYDLAALSRQDHRNLFPASVLPDRSMRLILADTTTDSIDALLFGPQAPIPYAPLAPKTAAALQHAWAHQVRSDPLGYLRERFKLFLNEVSITQGSLMVYDPAIDPNTLGYHTTFSWANNVANDYMQAFTGPADDGGIVFSVWLYLLICAVGAGVFLRLRSTRRLLIGALCASVITYQLGLLFGVIDVGYRFELPVVVAGEITILFAIRLLWETWRRRERAPAVA